MRPAATRESVVFEATRRCPHPCLHCSRPAVSDACALAETCQGGCKAAAQVCCGSASAPDPFLAAHLGSAVRPVPVDRR